MSRNSSFAGIGAGIMQGLQFAQNKAVQDQQVANQNALTSMRQEQFGWQRDEHDRTEALKTGFQEWMAKPDLTDMDRYSGFAKQYGNKMTPQEHLAIRGTIEPMVQQFGAQALNKALAGDVTDLQKVLDHRLPGSRAKIGFDQSGQNFTITTPDGKVQQIDRNGLGTALALTDWQSQEAAKAEAARKARLTNAQIDNYASNATLKDAQAFRVLNPLGTDTTSTSLSFGGTGAGGTGSGRNARADADANMLNWASYRKRFAGNNDDADTIKQSSVGHQNFLQLYQANPKIANTVDGEALLFGLSQDLATGKKADDVEFDPKTFSWRRFVTDPRAGKLYLDSGATDPSRLVGEDGKPRIDPATIQQREIAALTAFSKSNPDGYRSAVNLAKDSRITPEMLSAAVSGQPVQLPDGKVVNLPPAVGRAISMLRQYPIAKEQRLTPSFGIRPGGLPRTAASSIDTSGYGAGGAKGTSLAGELIVDPVVNFFKNSAAKARAED